MTSSIMTRSLRRIGLILASLVLIFVFFYTTEPRRKAYSCKTFGSCVGLDRATYYHDNLPSTPEIIATETTLRDGAVHFQRQIQNTNPSLLILVLNHDKDSWAADFRAQQRTIYDFLDLLVTTGLNLTDVSLGIMTSSRSEYDTLKPATDTLPFARTSLIHRPDPESPLSTTAEISYADRHKPEFQHSRRAAVAKLRNYLMLRALQDEPHILWLDADIVELSPGIIQTMLSHASATSESRDVGLITARCTQNSMDNYDKNAWAIPDSLVGLRNQCPSSSSSSSTSSSSDQQQGETKAQTAAANEAIQSRLMIPTLLNHTSDNDLIPLDAVGGTILYIRAGLVRMGVVFPWYNVVGTTWNSEGWIGIETEGICYLAARIGNEHNNNGDEAVGRCYVLGGSHSVRHADWG